MAGPHVAGIVALMREVNPNLTVDEIKDVLMNSTHDLGDPGEDNLPCGRSDTDVPGQMVVCAPPGLGYRPFRIFRSFTQHIFEKAAIPVGE